MRRDLDAFALQVKAIVSAAANDLTTKPRQMPLMNSPFGSTAHNASRQKRSGCGGKLPRPTSDLRAPKVLIEPRSLSWNRLFSKPA